VQKCTTAGSHQFGSAGAPGAELGRFTASRIDAFAVDFSSSVGLVM